MGRMSPWHAQISEAVFCFNRYCDLDSVDTKGLETLVSLWKSMSRWGSVKSRTTPGISLSLVLVIIYTNGESGRCSLAPEWMKFERHHKYR